MRNKNRNSMGGAHQKRSRLLLLLLMICCIAGLGILMLSGADIITIVGVGASIITVIVFGLFGYLHTEILDFKKKKNLSGKITHKELKAESNYFFFGSLDLCFTTLAGLILLVSIAAASGAPSSLFLTVVIIGSAIAFMSLFVITSRNYLQVRIVHNKINA